METPSLIKEKEKRIRQKSPIPLNVRFPVIVNRSNNNNNNNRPNTSIMKKKRIHAVRPSTTNELQDHSSIETTEDSIDGIKLEMIRPHTSNETS